MKYLPIQEIQPIEKDYSWLAVTWRILLFCLLGGGTLLSMNSVWGAQAPSALPLALAAAFGFGSAMVSDRLKRNHAAAGFLWMLPWPVLLLFTGVLSPWIGMQAWINQILARWNQIHEGGLSLFSVEAVTGDALAFSLVVMLLAGQLIWFFMNGRKILFCCLCCLFWIGIPLQSGTFSPYSGALLLTGLLGVYLPGRNVFITVRSTAWVLAAGVGMLLLASWLPAENMPEFDQFREDTADAVHEFRYGEDLLPNGDLAKADELQQQPGEELLQVQTGQVKNLYLKGFTGGRYKSGVWSALPDSAYGGDHAGMLEWLAERGFDPLTQSSEYFLLSENTEEMETNWLSVQIEGASRAVLYVPSSLSKVLEGSYAGQTDHGMESTGLRGIRHYMVEELSGTKPAELTVAEDWVSDPVTEEQQNYSEAESVYREFVYENYLQVNEAIADQMQKIFWDGEETESSSIYQALTRIRSVLEQRTSYSSRPGTVPEGEDPIRWFLDGSGEGNSMFYASAAVLALRTKGLPARYAEGYYLPSSQIGEDGEISVTGANAHAWVEVYFDGVGWLPVDVTPGYYYDVISLRQMLNLPDSVKKTAALEEDSAEAKPILDMDSTGESIKAPIVQVIERTAEIFLGVVGVLLLLFALVVLFLEVMRILLIRRAERDYREASDEDQIRIIEETIDRMLAFFGIEAALGWNSDETDQKLVRECGMEAGAYRRVSALMEKSIYGGIALEAYERRTLDLFVNHLWKSGERKERRDRLRQRYFILWVSFGERRTQKKKRRKSEKAKEQPV